MARPRIHPEGTKKYTLKFGEKQVFALRLLSRIRGETMDLYLGSVVEHEADKLKISRHWLQLWDEEPCVAMLNLFTLKEYKPAVTVQRSYGITHEDEVCTFVRAHPQFFYVDKAQTVVNRDAAIVLWPVIEEIALEWKRERHKDLKIGSKRLAAALKKAGVALPKENG